LKIKILGIDPALANTGLALAEYDLATETFGVVGLRLLQTEKGKKGKVVRASSDDLDRMSILHVGVQAVINEFKPSFAVAEVPTGTQSARGSFSNGGCCMMLAFVREEIPLIQVDPKEVKLAATGHKYGGKEEMIEWAVAKFPTAPWLTRKFKGKVQLLNDNEHLADAVAAVHAGIRTDQFKQAVSLMRAAMAA
jgi:Holliday junction resolvasome RuvABC endonuclease subunit